MAHSTVLAFAVILLALSGYYLSGPQEVSTGTVWYLQCFFIAMSTCTTVCINVWIFVREKRKEKEKKEKRYLKKMEEKRKEKEEKEKRYLKKMEEKRRDREERQQRELEDRAERRRNIEEISRLIEEIEERRRETEKRLLRLPERREDLEVNERSEGESKSLEMVGTLKSFLADKRRAMLRHIKDLRAFADAVDKIHKGATIASLGGATVSAAGGIISIAGLALIPFTLGASVALSVVGAGVSVAGGATKVASGVAEAKSNSSDKKGVQKILRSCAEDLDAVWKAMDDYEQYILSQVKDESRERLLSELQDIREEFLSVREMGFNVSNEGSSDMLTYIRSVIFLIINTVDDVIPAAAAEAARAGAQVAARTAVKANGILGAIFLPFEVRYILRTYEHLDKGAKSKVASKIREIADKIESLITRPPRGSAISGTETRK